MNTHSVGLAAPRMVHSCIIQNNSHGYVQVRIVYKGPAGARSGFHQEVETAMIPMGGMYRAKEHVMNHSSYQTRKEIDAIEVTRANGQTQRLTAPFHGVQQIELDWLFVVDNWQIHSVGRSR